MSATDTTDRTGPCSAWVTADAVLAQAYPDDLNVDPGVAALMASVASEVLYARSGRQFTGSCGPVTVRPLARPVDIDTRFGHRGAPSGYLTAGQYGAAWGVAGVGAINHYGTSRAPEVELGAYPITEIIQVKIDGVIIPSNEYLLVDKRVLLRMRPSASAQPTERYGWPVNQLLDLPDTEIGTFSVTYDFGVMPPQTGINAAGSLAKQLVLNYYDQPNVLPQRMTHISRQGVSVDVPDVQDFLAKGMTGIYEVDLFLDTWNPYGNRLKPLAWSPDIGRPRRYSG